MQDGGKEKLVFLLYMNRSGSTLLSSKLDQYVEIGVTPEANIPDGLLVSHVSIRSDKELTGYIDSLYADSKFQSWHVDRVFLEKRLRELGKPLQYGAILPVILSCYFSGSAKKVFVFKRGHYLPYVPQLRRIFSGCRFIFIERDIRAVFESQKRSIDSVTGKPMALNPVERAMKYVRTMKLVERYENDPDFLVVPFEQLIGSEQIAMETIISFLDVSNDFDKLSSYYDKIPSSQKHLHDGVLKSPDHGKIGGWKQALSPQEIHAIQRVAGSVMKKRNYGCYDANDAWLRNEVFFLTKMADLIFRHIPADMLRKIKK